MNNTSKKSFFGKIAEYFKDLCSLIRLDFYRAIKDKSVIVITAIVAGYSLMYVLLGLLFDALETSLFTTRDTVITATQLSSMPFIVISILICIFIGKDLNYGTIRNKIIAGYSKKQIYVSTLIVALSMAFVLLFLYQILSYLVGISSLGFPTGAPYPPISDFWTRLGLGYLLVAFAVSIVVFIEMTTRNMTAALVVSTIVFVLGPVISLLVSALIDTAWGSDSFAYEAFECFFLYDSYVISSGGFIFGNGFWTPVEDQLALKTLISSGASIVLLNWLGAYIFHKLDLK
mgnify:FL=1